MLTVEEDVVQCYVGVDDQPAPDYENVCQTSKKYFHEQTVSNLSGFAMEVFFS